jgi:mono/diheme cytochrome c family protein
MTSMKRFLFFLLVVLFACPAQASGYKNYYYRSGNTLYYRAYYPRQYYYNAVPYTTYYYVDKYVTDSKKADWQETYLRVVNQMKKDEKFNEAVALLLPQQPLQQGYAQQYAAPQQAALYPSQTGNTIGGFSSYQYARYGDVKSLDVNRAIELNQQGTDNVTRMAAELGQLSNGVAVQAVAVQNLNGERIGAIGEAQELRASLKEMQAGLRDQMLVQAEFMRSLRPAPSETFSGQRQQGSYYGGGHQGAPQQYPQQGPPASGPIQAPQGGSPTFTRYCASCHGPQAASPSGGWAWNGEQIDPSYWGGVYLRIDPNTPVKTQDGRALRMPPESSEQPSVEQRRQLVQELRAYVQL